ncbi:MAG: FAD-dependent oxidoreductase [Chloroflexi bacterium]|nr:FAD-dependent oxidoreductase [Chloroflexota bacterium]
MINKTIDTDVLVVGGGLAGCEAAIKAKNEHNSVLLVDKGYVSRSGASPFAAGAINVCLPEDDKDVWLREIVERGEYINDQEWVKLQLERGYPLAMELDEWGRAFGHTIFERDEQGNLLRKKARGNINTRTCVINAIPAMDTMRAKVIESKVSLLERVMVTDLVLDQGRVVGAIGLGYRDGKVYLLRAKSVVLSASGCGFKLFGMGHRNLTGEGQAMAYEAGAMLRNIDQAMSNTTARAADNHGMSLMAAAGGRFLNSLGEEFMWNYEPEIGNRARLSKLTVAIAREIAAGRGPVYMDLTATSEEDQKLMRKIVPEAFKAFASLKIDPFKEKVEWMPAFKGTVMHGGGIHIDITGASNVPGLYSAGDCSCTPEHGTWSITGLNLTFAIVSGDIAGRSAASYAREAATSGVQKSDVEETVASRLAPLDAKVGLTPDEVIYRMQKVLIANDVAYIRSDASLRRALGEIESIREEAVPSVKARNSHELVKALETRSMIRIAEMIVRSCLYREESRGFHYRTDYPLTDNDDWLKWIMVQRDEQGSMRVWAQNFPTPYLPAPSGKYPPK